MDKREKKGFVEVFIGILLLLLGFYSYIFSSVNGLIGFLSLIIGATLTISGFKKNVKDKDIISDKKGNGWIWNLIGYVFIIIAVLIWYFGMESCKTNPEMFCGLNYAIYLGVFGGIGFFILLIRLIKRFTK